MLVTLNWFFIFGGKKKETSIVRVSLQVTLSLNKKHSERVTLSNLNWGRDFKSHSQY